MKKTPSPSSQVVTMDKVILEVLVLCKKQALAIHRILAARSWSVYDESASFLYKQEFRHELLAEQIGRGLFNDIPPNNRHVWINESVLPVNKPIKVEIPSAMQIIAKLEAWTLKQTKPRDTGTFKSEKSGLINKERIRVPHR